MIVLKSSGDHLWPWADERDEAEAERHFKTVYPSLHAHMKRWESFVDPETGKTRGLRHREDQGRFWWELRPCAYYDAFDHLKIIYQELSWWQTFQIDDANLYLPNTAYLLASSDAWLLSVLNAPTFWWYSWRRALHGKDDALRLMKEFVATFPIPNALKNLCNCEAATTSLRGLTAKLRESATTIHDWLHHEFGLDRFGRTLAEPYKFDAEGFVTAVRAAMPKSRKWSAAELSRIEQEYSNILIPARHAATDIVALERKLSDLVNAAYGLTSDEVALMWRTAPPRMPLESVGELCQLGREVSV
jgi:hypothetical protein